MKKIVVLLSGRGSNMAAIAAALREERWPASIACVIADRPQAQGLARAAQAGLATAVVERSAFARRDDFERALAETIDAHRPDAVVLAGFMRVLGAAFVERYHGRLLNIHPSLLPAFPGLDTHRRALQGGVAVHGATVHYVGAEVDAGPIIAQAAVPVMPEDDEDALAARVLASEHRLYPMALRWHLDGRLRLQGTRVTLADPRPGEARWLWNDAR
ncbi:MAG: phosphoribosylglycinamide formyltransferase [Burkholderiales bacterium]|nr:phosphoribosylglycinamide formyltransferase [Burkholderiales bacterium]OJX04454.1 MAG: phosphoribosylglycinamide formyltransferase [Burkholderiales bacterium 70-64]